MAENITASDRWYRGKRKIFTYIVKNRAGEIVDISNFTAITWGCYATGAEPPADPIFPVKTLGDGVTKSDPVNGEFQVVVSEGDTASGVTPGTYDVQAVGTDENGVPDVLVKATAVLRQSPTFD